MGQLLAHDVIVADDATPARWLFVLHGIYGAGRNWSTIARRVARARPAWGVVLVDLRQHGGSQGFAGPHTVAAAAKDIRILADAIGRRSDAVLGHSFGGKVALAHAESAPPGLRQVWVVDSTPEARAPSGSAWRLLQVVRSLPARFDSRDALVEGLEREGFAAQVGQWMATNLVHRDGAYTWRFDLDSLEELLRDFFRTDLWSVVEDPPAGVALHFVKAEESSVLGDEASARIRAAGAAIDLVALPGGHWLNADNPDALVALLEDGLARG
jgi:pimeloyl-ACP methyl ester carboxylesterase